MSSNKFGHAMIATETAGTWRADAFTALPPDATVNQGAGTTYIGSIACLAPSECVAVGAYNSTTTNQAPMTIDEVGGVWGTASKPPLPSNGDTTPGHAAALNRVVCTSPGYCGRAEATSHTRSAVSNQWSSAPTHPSPNRSPNQNPNQNPNRTQPHGQRRRRLLPPPRCPPQN